MDDKNLYASFCFLDESFTLDEIKKLGKNAFNSCTQKTQICSVLNLQKTLVFDYGYTIKLLLTNQFGPYRKIFGS